MAESESIYPPSDHLHETQVSQEDAMKKLELYSKLGEDCVESVQKLSSLKFNIEQCGYLVDKLKEVVESGSLFLQVLRAEFLGLCSFIDIAKQVEIFKQKMSLGKVNTGQCGYLTHKFPVVVQSASLFLEVLRAEHHSLCSLMDIGKQVEIFKLQLALAKQVENFVLGCCKDSWIEAAMTSANCWEYVASIGFDLELCRVAFCTERAVTKVLTLDEVENIHKAEVEIVKKKACADADSLFQKVILEMPSLSSENKDLASYLIRRLKRIPTSNLSAGSSSGSGNGEDGGFLGRLFKRVTSLEQLGSGASGTVEKANWLGIQVAKKTFYGMENYPYFMKEVEVLSPLCHPNVMSMFCCAKNQRSCSIIMELMDGDLQALMQKRLEENSPPPFPILEAVDVMLQIGEGVNYLHNQRIVHRDLKSKNILVKIVRGTDSEDGYVHVKVADFGLSKTKAKSVNAYISPNVGTNRWMPPEIIKYGSGSQDSSSLSTEGPNYPFKCDTYSFAMVCFEVLTGDLPFPDIPHDREVKKQVLQGERPKLPKDPAHCPPMLKDLIERCWSLDPKDRPTFATICLELKHLKYLLMRGPAKSVHEATKPEFKLRVNEQQKPELQIQAHGTPGANQQHDYFFERITGAHEAAYACTKTFITFLKERNDLAHHEALQNVPMGADEWYRKLAVQAYICSRLFAGFENDSYLDSLDCVQGSHYLPATYRETDFFLQNQNLGKRHLRYLSEHDSLQRIGLQGVMNVLKSTEAASTDPFHLFCCRKLVNIMMSVDSWFTEFGFLQNVDYSKYSLLHQLAANPKYCDKFLKPFVKLAMETFLLHRLAFQFHPPARIFRYARGTRFDPTYMENVVPINADDSVKDLVVDLMLFPGFQVGGAIFKCRVFLVPSNTVVPINAVR